VAGKLGHDDAAALSKCRRDPKPVRGGAAEPVQQHQRRALPRVEHAQSGALDVVVAGGEAGKERVV
jgi:hypothetical protein